MCLMIKNALSMVIMDVYQNQMSFVTNLLEQEMNNEMILLI